MTPTPPCQIYTFFINYFLHNIHTCICPFSVYSYVFMFRVDHWDRIAYQGAHPWWRLFLISQKLFIACNFSSKGDGVNFLQSTLASEQMLPLCKTCLHSQIVEISWVQLPSHIQKTLSRSRCPGPLALRICPSTLLQCFLNLRCNGCIIDESVGVDCALHFDKLWIFVMPPVCYKKKLLCWKARATFVCGERDEYLGCS